MKDIHEYAYKVVNNFQNINEASGWENLIPGVSAYNNFKAGNYLSAAGDAAFDIATTGLALTGIGAVPAAALRAAKAAKTTANLVKAGKAAAKVKGVQTATKVGQNVKDAAKYGPRIANVIKNPKTIVAASTVGLGAKVLGDGSDAKEPGQRKEDEMRKALKQQAADALKQKPGEQHPGVGDKPNASSTTSPAKASTPAKAAAPATKKTPSDLTWSGYSAQKAATKGQGARQALSRETQRSAWNAAANKNLSKEARTKAAFLAKKLQDQDMRGGR